MKFTSLYSLEESRISNLKNENYAPNIKNDDFTRDRLIAFYTKFPNGTEESKKLNWGHPKELKNEDFTFLDKYISKNPNNKGTFDILIKSKNEVSKEEKNKLYNPNRTAEEIFSDKNMFHIYKEISNDDWLFVSPLSKKAAEYMNSVKCGGAGAKWCIGWEDDDSYWNNYITDKKCYFVLAFNKHYKTLDNIEYNGKKLDPEDLNPWGISVRWEDNGKSSNRTCKNKEILTKVMLQITKSSNLRDESKINPWIQPDWDLRDFQNLKQISIDLKVTKEDLLNLDFTEYNNIEKREQIVNNWAYHLKDLGIKVDLKNKSATVPEGTTIIKDSYFSGFSSIEEIHLPETVEELQPEAFYNCSSLKRINLPNSLKKIGFNAFDGCDSLLSIELPKTLSKIDNRAFKGCFGLKQISLPNTVESIELFAFEGCSNLEKISVSNNLKSIGNSAFCNCYNLTSIDLPESLETLDSRAFYSSYFEEIRLPDNIKVIEDETFLSCDVLKSISLPKNLIEIKKFAFQRCYSLEEIYIPDSVKVLDKSAFLECNSLKRISLPERLKNFDRGYLPKDCEIIVRTNNLEESKIKIFNRVYNTFN